VRLKLELSDAIILQQERKDILNLRREKHPDIQIYPCAGSFFKNIEPTSQAGKRQAAGFFLEQAGAKQLKIGGAQIFNKHANIIIKSKGCSSQDVYELSKIMQKVVKDKFNLDLVREVRFVGHFDGIPPQLREVIW
jgi:UDP-N-acetylmuramate dehydrogenase